MLICLISVLTKASRDYSKIIAKIKPGIYFGYFHNEISKVGKYIEFTNQFFLEAIRYQRSGISIGIFNITVSKPVGRVNFFAPSGEDMGSRKAMLN